MFIFCSNDVREREQALRIWKRDFPDSKEEFQVLEIPRDITLIQGYESEILVDLFEKVKKRMHDKFPGAIVIVPMKTVRLGAFYPDKEEYARFPGPYTETYFRNHSPEKLYELVQRNKCYYAKAKFQMKFDDDGFSKPITCNVEGKIIDVGKQGFDWMGREHQWVNCFQPDGAEKPYPSLPVEQQDEEGPMAQLLARALKRITRVPEPPEQLLKRMLEARKTYRRESYPYNTTPFCGWDDAVVEARGHGIPIASFGDTSDKIVLHPGHMGADFTYWWGDGDWTDSPCWRFDGIDTDVCSSFNEDLFNLGKWIAETNSYGATDVWFVRIGGSCKGYLSTEYCEVEDLAEKKITCFKDFNEYGGNIDFVLFVFGMKLDDD